MNKRRDYIQKMVALVLIACAIGLWLGETLRETLFPKENLKRKLYSGLFVLLKLIFNLSTPEYIRASTAILSSFPSLVQSVRSDV